MMVCRMESRLRDEVRAFATSLKMATSCNCRLVLRSGTTASFMWKDQVLVLSSVEQTDSCAYYHPISPNQQPANEGKPLSNNPKVTAKVLVTPVVARLSIDTSGPAFL